MYLVQTGRRRLGLEDGKDALELFGKRGRSDLKIDCRLCNSLSNLLSRMRGGGVDLIYPAYRG